MWFPFRAETLDFTETARRTWVTRCEIAAPRARVWEVYTDPTTWSDWFPGVRSASYRGGPPYGVGTVREANVGGQRFEEVMVAWEEGRRWAYYIDRATVPLARAQLECTEFEDCEVGTRLIWTVAADPRLILWLGSPFFQGQIDRLFARAGRNLESYHAVMGRAGAPAARYG